MGGAAAENSGFVQQQINEGKMTEPLPCLNCSHVVDFGPHVQTPFGMVATKVKYDQGKPFCVKCPHFALRASVLSIAQAA